MFCVISPCRNVTVSAPVIEINPRFVNRAYPARGGAGGAASALCCSRAWAVVEKARLRLRQLAQIDRVDVLGRIIVAILPGTAQVQVWLTRRRLSLGPALLMAAADVGDESGIRWIRRDWLSVGGSYCDWSNCLCPYTCCISVWVFNSRKCIFYWMHIVCKWAFHGPIVYEPNWLRSFYSTYKFILSHVIFIRFYSYYRLVYCHWYPNPNIKFVFLDGYCILTGRSSSPNTALWYSCGVKSVVSWVWT